MITRNSSTPLYIQVKDSIEGAIRSGKYQEGDKLPSEKELCDMYNVSRITIRKALELLESKDMIFSVHGKGTFVKAKIIRASLLKISTFGDTLAQRGYSGYTKIVSFQDIAYDSSFDMMFQGANSGRPSGISLTGYSEGIPVVYYDSIIRNPYGREMYECAKLLERDKVAFSTFDLYKEIGVDIGRINQRVLAINADKKLVELLDLTQGDPVLVLESVLFSKEMLPIEFKKAYYRTDKYSFNLYREL